MTSATQRGLLGASEHYADLSAGRYRYLRWGDPAHPTVILLHGRTSLVETWHEVASALGDRWHVLALEQRGHGGSPWDADGRYNLIDFLTDLEEFVETVAGGRRHILIGHSMGSCTSLVYAGRNPGKVAALVLEDGGPPGPTVEQAVADDLATSPTSFADWSAARDHIAASHPHLSGARLDHRVDHSIRPGERGEYCWRADVRALLDGRHFDELMEHGQWEATDALKMDTLFLWANAPHLVEPEVVDEMVRRNSRVRKVEFPTGHSIHEERLDLFLDTVLPFVEDHRGLLS